MPVKQFRQADPTTEIRGPDVAHLPRSDFFGKFASGTTRITGGRWGFVAALGFVVTWAMTGPFFHFSDQWQLVVNSVTSIVTFLMVFLIQNAQNRESKALHLKLDELILSTRRARNELIDVELLTDEQLERLSERYRKVSEGCQKNLDAPDFLNPPPEADDDGITFPLPTPPSSGSARRRRKRIKSR